MLRRGDLHADAHEREREPGGDDPFALAVHAAARVDDEADGDGAVFVAEERDALRLSILVHGERLTGQARDETVLAVYDRDVQDDEIGAR